MWNRGEKGITVWLALVSLLFAFDHQPIEFSEVLAFPELVAFGFLPDLCSYSIREYKPCEITNIKIWFIFLTKFLKQLFCFPNRSYLVCTSDVCPYECLMYILLWNVKF